MLQRRLLENLETQEVQENPWSRAAIKRFSINLLHRFSQITGERKKKNNNNNHATAPPNVKIFKFGSST